MSANDIVTINVSITNPPIPSQLQKTGAFISQGGTTTAAGTLTLLTSSADLATILASAKHISALSYNNGTHLVTATATAHGLTPLGEQITVVVSGCTPAAYNGTFLATIVDANTFTYSLASNPGTATVFGTVTDEDVEELVAMNTTYWAQANSQTSVYVLELGNGTTSEGVTALNTFITENPNTIYSYLIPRTWDSESTFKTMVANYNAPSTAVNFFVTTTILTYDAWSQLDNCVFAMVEAPGIPVTEFSCAAPFQVTLAWSPNSAQKVPPLAFSFVYGVTPYPTRNNLVVLTDLKDANIGYIDLGSEGGLVNTIIKWGHVLGGNPFNYWYTVDWSKINLELDLANEAINGSNNALAPLYYNQNGIDRLQNRAAQTLRNGISYGLVLGDVIMTELDPTVFATNVGNGLYAGNAVINAVPFPIYTKNNPSDYMLGKYAGLQAAITPSRGFEQIVFQLSVVNFVS